MQGYCRVAWVQQGFGASLAAWETVLALMAKPVLADKLENAAMAYVAALGTYEHLRPSKEKACSELFEGSGGITPISL